MVLSRFASAFLVAAVLPAADAALSASSTDPAVQEAHQAGFAYWRQGRYGEAAHAFREEADRLRESNAPPADLARARFNLAEAVWKTGGLADAAALLEQVAETIGSEPLGNGAPAGTLTVRRAELAIARGRFQEARSLLDRMGSEPLSPVTFHLARVRAELDRLSGDLEAAAAGLEKALERLRQSAHPAEGALDAGLAGLSLIYRQQGRLLEAEKLARETLAIRRRELEPAHPRIAEALRGVAEIQRLRGDWSGAEGSLREALVLARRAYGADHPQTANIVHCLANVMAQTGNTAEAERLLAQALAVFAGRLGDAHPYTIAVRNTQGAILYASGRLLEARQVLRSALGSSEALAARSPLTAALLHNLAMAEIALGHLAEGRLLLERAIPARLESLGPEHPDTAASKLALARLLARDGETGAARTLEAQARHALASHAERNLLGHSIDWRLLRRGDGSANDRRQDRSLTTGKR